MTPVQTLYRWFNDNPEATYKEALEAYEHCLELEQQLPQQETLYTEEEIIKAFYIGRCYQGREGDTTIEQYLQSLKQNK